MSCSSTTKTCNHTFYRCPLPCLATGVLKPSLFKYDRFSTQHESDTCSSVLQILVFFSHPLIPMKPQVIVIGGGVIGAAAAYFIARRGLVTLLMERKHLGAGASGATASMIALSGSAPEPLLSHAAESHRLIPTLESETGINLEIVRGGSLNLASTEDEVDSLKTNLNENLEHGIESRMITEVELREIAPFVSNQVIAALHRPDNYHVNPFRLYEAYLRGAVNAGAKVSYNTEVREVCFSRDKIDRVVTSTGDHQCEFVVVACGAYTAQLMAQTGVELPVVPARGQAIVTEACPSITPYMINLPGHFYTRQVLRGNFYLGTTTEYVGFDRNVTLDKIFTITRGLVRAIPMLARLRAIRFFSGFRPSVTDQLPIIGRLPQCKNLLVATGHGGGGMIYSASTGRTLSELIVDGKSQLPIDAFAPDRFANGST